MNPRSATSYCVLLGGYNNIYLLGRVKWVDTWKALTAVPGTEVFSGYGLFLLFTLIEKVARLIRQDDFYLVLCQNQQLNKNVLRSPSRSLSDHEAGSWKNEDGSLIYTRKYVLISRKYC